MATQNIGSVPLSSFSVLPSSDLSLLEAALVLYKSSLSRRVKAEPDPRIKAIVSESVADVDRLLSNVLKVSS